MMKIALLPKSVALELTYRCNHHCKFCSCPWYATNSTYHLGKELTVDQWKTVVRKLYQLGVESFSISGGEFLLKEGFDDIIHYIRTEGNRLCIKNPIVVISNALAMKEEYLWFFKEHDVHLSMSLPGYETVEEHTGVDNADGVLRWFQLAKDIGLKSTVNITVTRKNYDELFQTIALGLINGAQDILLNRFLPGGRGLAYMDELNLTTEQLNGMLDTAEEALTYANRKGNVGTEIPMCAIKDVEKYKHIHVGYQCAAAKGFFVVDPAGYIRTCNHSPRVVGHVFESSMITDVDYWNVFAKRDYQPDMCTGCKLSHLCDCGCREVASILHGSPKEKDTSIDFSKH